MSRGRPVWLILTCEHATHAVPAPYRSLFRGHEDILISHRGWDPGTLALGRALKRQCSAPLFATSASRLLVEVNRSLHHRNLFSEFSRGLSNVERQVILSSYYLPYRQAVEDEIRTAIDNRKTILHLSLHSFTPTLAGVARNAEIGLLYDSRREREALFCRELRRKLLTHVPGWRIRRNYPYLGRADGFTTHLRRLFRADHYLGIELEVNQRLMSPDRQKATIGRLVAALKPPLIS